MTCREITPLLAERASGPLPAADEARLAAHLPSCAACRAEGERLAGLLAAARAPGASAAEERLARDLPGRIAAAARRPRERARSLGLGMGLGLAAAAAVAVVLVTPAPTGQGPSLPAERAVASAESGEALAETDAIADAEALWDLSADIDVIDEDLE